MGKNLIADLRASLTWDLDDFERGTAKIDSGFGKLIDRARQFAADFASVGERMTKTWTVGVAAMGAAFTARTVMFANDAKAIKVAANTAAEGVESFQRRAFAAEREAGVAMEKFADISKDTLDKVGDYFATGGGELKEFFEDVAPRVGVTAEMFRGLSGPDALQLFYNTLDRANVSQQEMVFFLESIADEGSLLIPLLAENGRLFEELGKKANVFSAADIERYIRLKESLDDLGMSFDKLWQAIAATGLIDWLSAAIEKGAGFIERLSQANPLLFKIVVALLAAAAAAGPLLMLFTSLAVVILPLFLAGLGGIWLALSAVINPLGTLLVVGTDFAGVIGARILPLLGKLAVAFLGLSMPIGAAIAIVLLFADRIVDGLRYVWREAERLLGPAFKELILQASKAIGLLSDAIDALARSELGQFLADWIEGFGNLVQVIVMIAGSAVVSAFAILIDLVAGLLESITDFWSIVSAILEGDWPAVWLRASHAIENMVDRVKAPFETLWNWIRDTLALLGLMEVRADRAHAAARGETPRQSRTLGGGTVRTSDLVGGNLTDIDSIRAPDAREPWRRTPDAAKPKKTSRGGTGPSAEELADRRAALKLEHEIAVARESGDMEALRALERKRELQRAIEQYERAGLSAAQARVAAEKDMLELDEARAKAAARERADHERSFDMQLAMIREDHAHLKTLEDEEFVQREIEALEADRVPRAEAEAEAAKKLLALEEARADAIERRAAAQRAAHSIELAELRGDRLLADQLREDERIRARADDLSRDGTNPADALDQAYREAADRSRAYLQGSYRDAFRGGLYAAMNGNFWDWFQDRMRDSSFNALAKVLDRLADRFADMLFDSREGSGGGFLAAIGGLLGLGGGSSSGGVPGAAHGGAHSVPGFNSGGSFKVRGFAGIDRNILSLNGTPVARVSQSEIIDVKRGEQSGQGSGGRGALAIHLGPGLEAQWLRKAAGQSVEIVKASAGPLLEGASAKARRDAARPITPGGVTG